MPNGLFRPRGEDRRSARGLPSAPSAAQHAHAAGLALGDEQVAVRRRAHEARVVEPVGVELDLEARRRLRPGAAGRGTRGGCRPTASRSGGGRSAGADEVRRPRDLAAVVGERPRRGERRQPRDSRVGANGASYRQRGELLTARLRASSGDRVRIVSLLASGTELVCALGLGERLVGRSHECDHPAWVTRLPALSRPTFDVDGHERRDRRAACASGCAPARRSTRSTRRALAALAPDVIITQTHCEVCAVSARRPRPRRRRPRAGTPAGRRAGGRHVDGILDGFGGVAARAGRADAGRAPGRRACARGCDAARGARRSALRRPRVACLEWIEPLFAMGNWGPELVALAGGDSLLGAPARIRRRSPGRRCARADPDVSSSRPAGSASRARWREMPALAAQPGWASCAPCAPGASSSPTATSTSTAPGPLLFETPEILAEMLHPAVFPPRHEGTAWRRFAPS